jgi:outer membrane protein OmpA-like peptidoglycan-associated protein
MLAPAGALAASGVGTTVLFDYDKSDLRSDTPTGTALQGQASWLKGTTNTVQVVGHADVRGTAEYNIGLSEARAASVKNYLVGQGINEARISTLGRGESEAAPGNTEAVHQSNRKAVTVQTN